MNNERTTLPNYEGKYVAYNTAGTKVIAWGTHIGPVIDKARELGVEVPTVVYVPDTNTIVSHPI